MEGKENKRFALIVPNINPLLKSCVFGQNVPMLPKFGVLATTKGKKTLKISKAAMKELRSASASKELCLKTYNPKAKSREKKALAKKELKVNKGFENIHKKFDAVNVSKANETVENNKRIAELRAQSAALSQDLAVLKDQLHQISLHDSPKELKTSLGIVHNHAASLLHSVEEIRKSKETVQDNLAKQTDKETALKQQLDANEAKKRELQAAVEQLETMLISGSGIGYAGATATSGHNKENSTVLANRDPSALLFEIWSVEREISVKGDETKQLQQRWVNAERLKEEMKLKVGIAKEALEECNSNNRRIQREVENDEQKISGIQFDLKQKARVLQDEVEKQQATKLQSEKAKSMSIEAENDSKVILDNIDNLKKDIAHLHAEMSRNTQRITTSWKCIDQEKTAKTQSDIKLQKLKKHCSDLSKTQVDLLVDLKVLRNTLMI